MTKNLFTSIATTLAMVGLAGVASIAQADILTPAIASYSAAKLSQQADVIAAAKAAGRAQDSYRELSRFFAPLNDWSTQPSVTTARGYAKTARDAAAFAKTTADTAEGDTIAQQKCKAARAVAEAAAQSAAASVAAAKSAQFAKVASGNPAASQVLAAATTESLKAQQAATQSAQYLAAAQSALSAAQGATSVAGATAAAQTASRAAASASAANVLAQKAGDASGELLFSVTPKAAKVTAREATGYRLVNASRLDMMEFSDLEVSKKSPWWVEAAVSMGVANEVPVLYHYGLSEAYIYGADITIGREIANSKFSLDLRVGIFGGDDSSSQGYRSAEYEMSGLNIMPGVRYRDKITGKLYGFAGFNVGVGLYDLSQDITQGATRISYDGDKLVLAASFELGVDYQHTENLGFFASYYFYGTPNAPAMKQSGSEPGYTESFKPDNMFTHSLRVGVNYNF